MKNKLCAFTLSLVIIGDSSTLLFACGDKFMVPNRGSRSQRPAAQRPASTILIYDSAADLQRGLKGSSATDILTKAGLKPTVVSSSDELEKALNSGRWDAVLVGYREATSVRTRLRSNSFDAVVIPVSFDATDAQIKEMRKEYPVVVRVPAKHDAFLSAIDKALGKKPRTSKALD